MSKILLTPVGSSGDVNPFVGIGARLRQRGHDVQVLANPHFEKLIRSAGLQFLPMSNEEEYQEIINHPDLWHPTRSMALLFGSIFDVLDEAYRKIEEWNAAGGAAIVAPRLAIYSRLANAKLGVPLAGVALQPMIVRSIYSPMRSPLLRYPRYGGKLAARFFYWMMNRKMDEILAPRLNALCHDLGLPKVKRSMLWLRSPELELALWPEWLYGRQPDWPAHTTTTGFIRFDGISTETEAPAATIDDELLASKPIVFTAGTAMAQADDFFAVACSACERLGREGLLLTQRPQQLPRELPDGVRHLAYAPFAELLPRAAALVHHGGIGTAARALEAGIPQLIMPMAFDQYDNASRFAALGVASEVAREEFTGDNVAAALERLLGSSIVAERCKRYSKMIDSDAVLDRTCELIEGHCQA